MNKDTITSGAADLPEALRLADEYQKQSEHEHYGRSLFRQVAAELRRLHTESEMRRTALLDEMQKAALTAGQATAAQQGAAYAALRTSIYAGRVYEEGFLIGTCPLYTADQLHAFADATCALRASHGQAPAETGNSVSAQPDSVQEDADRLDFLIEQRAYVVSDPDACPGHWLHWAMPDGRTWVQGDEHPTPRAAIDAARKQGEKQ